jgi:hypothetical protein
VAYPVRHTFALAVALAALATAPLSPVVAGSQPTTQSSASQPHQLFVIDGSGTSHDLGRAVDLEHCRKAMQAAPRDIPAGIKEQLGPPPWRFECRHQDTFAPGWDKIIPGR